MNGVIEHPPTGFPLSLRLKCFWSLQAMEILPSVPLCCESCGKQFKGPHEGRRKSKKVAKSDVDDTAGRHGGDGCTDCHQRRLAVGSGSNLEHVRNWPVFFFAHARVPLCTLQPLHCKEGNLCRVRDSQRRDVEPVDRMDS